MGRAPNRGPGLLPAPLVVTRCGQVVGYVLLPHWPRVCHPAWPWCCRITFLANTSWQRWTNAVPNFANESFFYYIIVTFAKTLFLTLIDNHMKFIWPTLHSKGEQSLESLANELTCNKAKIHCYPWPSLTIIWSSCSQHFLAKVNKALKVWQMSNFFAIIAT